jgi:hypothetical protein
MYGNSPALSIKSKVEKILFRFQSRDLHMVLPPTKDGKPVRFRVKLDGTTPGADCGTDSAPDGTGEVRDRVSTSSSGKRVQQKTGLLRSNSLIPSFRPFHSRLARTL